MTKFLDTAGLTYFFTGLKKIFVRKVNGTAPDENGNVAINNMTGATASAAGKAGLVPAPAAGAQAKYLCGDGTWQTPPDTNTTYSNMTGATTSAAGAAGLVPEPAAATNNKPFCGDGTFKTLPIAGGGTGGTTADDARANLGLNPSEIPANSDLNDYTTTGSYTCWTTTTAKTLVNSPFSDVSTGIVLEVTKQGTIVFQKIYGTLVAGCYTRRYGGSTWNEWKPIASSSSGDGIVASSLGTNGYVKYANGLIQQWGVGTSFTFSRSSYATPQLANEQTITFPIAFTTACYGIQVEYIFLSGVTASTVNPYATKSTSSFKLTSISQQDSSDSSTTVQPIFFAYGK